MGRHESARTLTCETPKMACEMQYIQGLTDASFDPSAAGQLTTACVVTVEGHHLLAVLDVRHGGRESVEGKEEGVTGVTEEEGVWLMAVNVREGQRGYKNECMPAMLVTLSSTAGGRAIDSDSSGTVDGS